MIISEEVTLNSNDCFVKALSRLKESSLDAIESSEYVNAFTQYLHVDRPVQYEFDSIVKQASQTNKAELILLCGSVGDGKSHMLSFYKAKYPELMKKFVIHNDSTASFYKDKPATYTLKKVLDEFCDEKIYLSSKKMILAINLGILTEFLESENGQEFSLLKNYVENVGILRDDAGEKTDNPNCHFHYVNFSDYHLFSLTENGPKSDYIDKLIQRITDEVPDNMINSEFHRCCGMCENKKNCPVSINYELLADVKIRESVIELLIESIVKNKLIISTRALLNYIYEILVDERFIKISSTEPKKEIKKLGDLEFCKSLLPNTMFSRSQTSVVIDSMKSVDPLNKRDDKIDSFIIEYTNKEEVIQVFKDILPEVEKVIKRLEGVEFSNNKCTELKQEILKLLIRLYRLYGKTDIMSLKDEIYIDFMNVLYWWNAGKKIKLKELYELVKYGALNWNGRVYNEEMKIPVLSVQNTYTLIQEVVIKRITENIGSDRVGQLDKFCSKICLMYGNEKNTEKVEVEIDYKLYMLLKYIKTGYCPNLKDKRLNVKFDNFVEKVASYGKKNEYVYIEKLESGKVCRYKLSYDSEFGYELEVIK